MTPEQQAGLELEPYIARLYQRKLGDGWSIHRPGDPIFSRGDMPWMLASPDFVAVRLDGEYLKDDSHLLEAKSTQWEDGWGEPGTAEVPRHYWIQAQQQMFVTGTKKVVIGRLYRGVQFDTYPVEYDNKFCWEMVEILSSFWKMVESRTAPAPDWNHPKTAGLIRSLVDPSKHDMAEAAHVSNVELLGDLMEYEVVRQDIKRLEAEKERLYARILCEVAATPKCVVNGRFKVNLIKVSRKEYTVPAGDHLQMRVSEVKQK